MGALSGEPKSGEARPQGPGKGPHQDRAERNSESVKVFDPSAYLQSVSLCSWEDAETPCTLRVWSKFYKADPRIALGKYSPLEKEILIAAAMSQRLGGAHSSAARRFLLRKQREEQKELRELKLRSWGSELKHKCSHLSSVPCVGQQQAWSARVRVPPPVLPMPPREAATVSRHVERVRLCWQQQHQNQSLGAGSERPQGGGLGLLSADQSTEEAAEEAETELLPLEDTDEAQADSPRRTWIQVDVPFKDEEPPKALSVPPGQGQLWRSRKRAGGPRPPHATGLAHQNRLAVADFPGDLLLMARSFTAWGVHAGDPERLISPQEKICSDRAREFLGTH